MEDETRDTTKKTGEENISFATTISHIIIIIIFTNGSEVTAIRVIFCN